jgi:hypothetical protein
MDLASFSSRKKKRLKSSAKLGCAGLIALLSAACSIEVQMKHEPMVARDTDAITFTAETEGGDHIVSEEIKMFVAGTLVKTCSSSPCVYTGGPYPGHTNGWLIYHAEAEGEFEYLGLSGRDVDVDLGATGITDADMTWKDSDSVTHIPVRWGAYSATNTNILFQRSDDYNTTSVTDGLVTFLGDLSNKIHDILMDKEEIWGKMQDLNLYAYRRFGNTDSGCPGSLSLMTFSETGSFVDDHGVMHVQDFTDCTGESFDQFSFEGSTNTQAFLHEFSHSVFRLGDEYSGFTYYFEAEDEPNIFDLENTCRVEQVTKGRDPDDCVEFTSQQTGWWGTHSGITVMTNGLKNHVWSLESTERLRWWFEEN